MLRRSPGKTSTNTKREWKSGLAVRGTVLLALAVTLGQTQEFDSAAVSGVVVDSKQEPIPEV